MAIIEIDQTLDTPLTTFQRGQFLIRFAFARSKDAKVENLRGEDYLVFRVEPTSLAFAICDGVGGSFFGGFAAQILGELILKWLWANETHEQMRTGDEKAVLGTLNKFLNSQIALAKDFVDKKDILGIKNQFIRGSYLEKKQKSGSQSNFVCGLINAPTEDQKNGDIWLFWLGDAKLKVWQGKQNKTDELHATFPSEQSWSSNDGVRGKIYFHHSDFTKIDFIAAHTDGMNPFENELEPSITPLIINEAINNLQNSHNSDDISYLDISMAPTTANLEDDIANNLRGKIYSQRWIKEYSSKIVTLKNLEEESPEIKADQNQITESSIPSTNIPNKFSIIEDKDIPNIGAEIEAEKKKNNIQQLEVKNKEKTFLTSREWKLLIIFFLVSVLFLFLLAFYLFQK